MTRLGIMVTGGCALAALVTPVWVRPVPRLVWNARASVPIGLYAARPAASARRGDLVAAHAPAPVARLMAERHYLPLRVPMLKHVAAVSGQVVCRSGPAILVDGERVAGAQSRDRMGRLLPRWNGCRSLRRGEIFLLNPASAGSFDGRYFGPISAHGIVAVLDPLWLPGGGRAASASALARQEHPSQPQTKGPRNDQDR